MVNALPAHVTPLLAANLMVCPLEPKSIVDVALRFNVVLEPVIIVLAAIEVVLNFPPFKIICEVAIVAVVEVGFNRSSPAVIVVVPV